MTELKQIPMPQSLSFGCTEWKETNIYCLYYELSTMLGTLQRHCHLIPTTILIHGLLLHILGIKK